MADPLLDLIQSPYTPENPLKIEIRGTSTSQPADPLLSLIAPGGAPQPEEKPAPTFMEQVGQQAGNVGAGLLRGAGSIGATLLYPYDKAKDLVNSGQTLTGDKVSNQSLSGLITGNAPLTSNEQRRASMDAALREFGAEPDSFGYGAGKLGGEIAGTLGVGPALAAGLRAVPAVANAVPSVVNAIQSNGMTTGATGLGSMLARIGGGAVTGGASAGLVDPKDAGTGAVIGGVLPPAISGAGKLGGAAWSKLTGGITPEVQDLAKKAAQYGIDVPVDRLVNSKPLNAVASSLNYVPLSGRAATEELMQEQLNRALSRTVGQDMPNVTMALRKAGNDLGAEFDRVLSTNTVNVDKQLMTDLAQTANLATSELERGQAGIIHNQIDEILSKAATGQIDGQAAYNIKKTLDRISNRNSAEAYYARELKQNLMDALNRSMGPQEAAAFAKTRQQYSNMLKLENLAQNGADGNISIARLANMKNINSPELQDLADISAQFLKPREGQHGAAQRVVGTGLAAGAALLGKSGLLPGGLATAGVAGAGMAGSRLANALLNSQAIKNAMVNPTQNQALANVLRQSMPISYQAGQFVSP